MNIFILADRPRPAARMLCDKHVVKMIVESTQILSTVHHRYHTGLAPYRETHKNHPCVRWAGDSIPNYSWLRLHALSMCEEYTERYGKVHKCEAYLNDLHAPHNMDIAGRTDFVQCMPDQYKHQSPVIAYRQYYLAEKAGFAKWRNNNAPLWFENQDPWCEL